MNRCTSHHLCLMRSSLRSIWDLFVVVVVVFIYFINCCLLSKAFSFRYSYSTGLACPSVTCTTATAILECMVSCMDNTPNRTTNVHTHTHTHAHTHTHTRTHTHAHTPISSRSCLHQPDVHLSSTIQHLHTVNVHVAQVYQSRLGDMLHYLYLLLFINYYTSTIVSESWGAGVWLCGCCCFHYNINDYLSC
jgi:hypothetical protein